MITLTYRNQTKQRPASEKFFTKIIRQAAASSGVKHPLGLSLNLIGRARSQALNARYRRKNRPTDVLSFGLGKIENKAQGDIMELGDIFICLPIAQRDARLEAITLKNKLAVLTIHGFLHLLGHDHITPRQQKSMFALQTKILNHLGTPPHNLRH